MGTFVAGAAGDIINAALSFYVRGKALAQTIQDKPLLKWLKENGKTFPGGKDVVSLPVQINFMSDTAGFLAGYSEDDALTFGQAQNVLRASYSWKEVQAGLVITLTELKKDGISVSDRGKTSEHSEAMLTRLTGLLENRLDDFMESWARAMNKMFWQDGAQDAKQVPGVTSILPGGAGSNVVGTVGGISRVTYASWRHRLALGIVPSGDGQTLIQKLRSELLQLRRFGGKPNKWLCGSGFLDALRIELQAKGQYTLEGFSKDKATDIGMADVHVPGLGRAEYDPTLDDLGWSKYAFVMDSKHINWRPMEGEENKIYDPERPYNYLVFLKTMTNTGALVANQLNCHEVFSVA